MQARENLSGKLVSDQQSQTVYLKYELSAKVESMILKNEVSTSKLPPPKVVRANASKNQAKVKFRGQSGNFFFADILLFSSYW